MGILSIIRSELLTVPLGLIGVVIGLLVARSYFGFMSLLVVISLFGSTPCSSASGRAEAERGLSP